ncbi:hypothetical protein [Crenalkalicoccus roseus]|jgi:hypothetical protein|uniref:hypothetical protein n=1 Tax=Crenalkalicoccus roseus TaxID=1485588 RepID=UPI0010804C7F|nr:hypothetical protein [Crenalkalicoccus roseus]
MGGLFRAPKPVIVAPAPTQPEPAPTAEAETVGEAARAEARARSLRGRPGTIATSARGVLAPLPAARRKTLLGE